jgi:hypothetical protein
MVDFGETKILEGQLTQSRYGLFDAYSIRAHLLQ